MWSYVKYVQDKENKTPVIDLLSELLASGVEDIRILNYMPVVNVRLEGEEFGIATLELIYKK